MAKWNLATRSLSLPCGKNSTKDMSSFVTAVDTIAAQFGCATLLVHHTGHASKGRARGAIALTGAVDFEYKITSGNAFITMECTKAKDLKSQKLYGLCFSRLKLRWIVKLLKVLF